MLENELHNDEVLVQDLINGDENSFITIYNKYFKQLFYKAEAILGEENLAEDCVQDVFMDLWRRREQLKIDHLAGYLKMAVRFKTIDIIRSKRIHRKYYQRIAEATTELFINQPLLYKELETIFKDTIQSMPPDRQEIFQLAREKGLTYREIAELKGISIKTVEKKMSLSLRDLRVKLGDFIHLFF